MSISTISNKIILLSLIAILTSVGTVGHSVFSNAELTEHITDESPHLGTKITLQHLTETVEDNKKEIKLLHEKIDRVEDKIDKLYYMICSHNGYECN